MKWNCLILFLLLLAAYPLCAQDTIINGEPFTLIEKLPTYPGGEEALFKFLGNNIKYPPKARRKGISGRVYINFVIDEKGNVTNATVLRGVHKLIDDEALRVMKLMPKWNPGIKRGKAVKVSYNMPIKFSLTGS